MAENYSERSKEDLLEIARERDLPGRSSMNKDELAEALAKDDEEKGTDDTLASQVEGGQNEKGGRGAAQTEGSDFASRQQEPKNPDLFNEEYGQDAEDLEGKVGAPEDEAQRAHHSPASDPHNPAVQEELSPEGQEALEEYGEDSAALEEADLALDASGPLHLEKPSERFMTGAVNEDHAKELEEVYSRVPENYVGDLPEKPTDEQYKLMEKAAGDPDKEWEEGDSIDPNDVYEDKDLTLKDVEEGRDERKADLFERDNEQRRSRENLDDKMIEETVGHQESPVQPRTFQQRAQLYTDGLSGPGAHRIDRAFHTESLRSGIFHDTFNRDGGPNEREKEIIEAEDQRREATDYGD